MTVDHSPQSAAAVLVIGNGPVGQTAALLLARWGVPVVLLDRRAECDAKASKAIVQQRDVLDIWEAVGAGRQIADEGVTWSTARTFYRQHEIFHVTYPGAFGAEFPPFVNISQARIEEILDERIAQQPLIDVRWNHTASALQQTRSSVLVHCQTPGGLKKVAGSFGLVAAGARSEDVRASLGLQFAGMSFDDRFLICDIKADLPKFARERRFYFDPPWNPGRQVLVHPCPGSTFRIDWQVPITFDLNREEINGGLHSRITTLIGTRAYEIVWKSVYRFHARIVDRMRVGRYLVAGDSAHLVSPFGARGLNSGVADAENAAWKLAAVWHGWAPDALLETYHEERHAAAPENLDVTSATMRFLAPASAAELRARQVLLESAATAPACRAKVNSGRLAEPFWYANSSLVTADPTRPNPSRPVVGNTCRPGPGVLLPNLAVRVGDGTRTWLRRIARDGCLVLTVDSSDADVPTAWCGPPVRMIRMADLDPTGALTRLVGARAGEVWVIRPDAYVAAVLQRPDSNELGAALARSLAGSSTAPSRQPGGGGTLIPYCRSLGDVPEATPAAPQPGPVPPPVRSSGPQHRKPGRYDYVGPGSTR